MPRNLNSPPLDPDPQRILTWATDTGDENYMPVSDLATQADLDSKADLVDGKVPASQLPAYVDDVLEFANLASFPVTGESGKIYVALDTNKTYRWSGTVYVEISASIALGETSSTAYRGDRGKIAYDHTFLMNNPHGVTAAQVGLGNVNNTSDADKPISTAQAGVNALKANDDNVVHKTGVETIADDKTFTGNLTVSKNNITFYREVSTDFYGIEWDQGDASIKQLPTAAELRISCGREANWGGFISFITDTTEKARITGNGNLIIGGGTDSGEKLNVNGPAKITGSLTAGSVTSDVVMSGVAESSISTTDGSADSVLVTKDYLLSSIAKYRRKVSVETGTAVNVIPDTATVYRLNSTDTGTGVSVLMPVISGNTGVSIIVINNSPVNAFVRANTLPNTDLWENGQLVSGFVLPPGKAITLINDSLKWVVMNEYKATQTLTKTANYQIASPDYIGGELSLFVDASGGNRTITLENHGNMVGKKVRVIKTDSSANSITIQGDANINGASTFLLTAQYQNVQIEATTVQYWITN